MSGAWEWADNASSSAHLQRSANGTVTRSQAAYRAYIAHGATCTDGCPEAQCATSEELWQAYQSKLDGGAR